jgi:hypothetical protein
VLRAQGRGAAADALVSASAAIAAAPTLAKAITHVVAAHAMSDDDLRAAHDAVLVAHHVNCTFVVALPRAFVERQAAALARRFGTDDVDAMRRVARVYVCPNCSRVKNFFVTRKDYQKETRVRACGFEKMVHPSALEWAGADADAPPPPMPLRCAATEVRAGARPCPLPPSFFFKETRTQACRKYAVTAHDLLTFGADGSVGGGGVLQTVHECLTIAPCCGVLVATNALRCVTDGFMCPVCTAAAAKAAAAAAATAAHQQPAAAS